VLRIDRERIPVLRPDLKGYVVGQEVVDGFADRQDLSHDQRLAVARLAERFAPDGVSNDQKALLADAKPQPASELGLALAADEDQLTGDFLAGALDDLPSNAWRVISNPAELGSTYPLTGADLQKLTGASYRQVRYWNESDLLPAQVIDGERRYFAAGLAKAFMLFEAEKYQVAAANAVQHGGSDGRRVLRLIGASLVENARYARPGVAASKLLEAGQSLMRYGTEIVDRPVGRVADVRRATKRTTSARTVGASGRQRPKTTPKRAAKVPTSARARSGARRSTPQAPSVTNKNGRS
jgi:hypothetical protein